MRLWRRVPCFTRNDTTGFVVKRLSVGCEAFLQLELCATISTFAQNDMLTFYRNPKSCLYKSSLLNIAAKTNARELPPFIGLKKIPVRGANVGTRCYA
jgi:hypothetical protein